MPCKYEKNVSFTLDSMEQVVSLEISGDSREFYYKVSFDEEQLDSLENCFYAMYMLIRNSKD